MQSSHLPTVFHKILSCKLEHIWDKHAEIQKVMLEIEKRMKMAEEKLNELAESDSYPADEKLSLVMEIDDLLKTMKQGYKVLSGESKFEEMIPERGKNKVTNKSGTSNSSSNSNDTKASTSLLQIQMEVLEDQVLSLQKIFDAKFPEIEFKVKVLEEDNSLKNNLAEKLQLIQSVQLRDSKSVNKFEKKFTKLEKHVMSVKNDLDQLDVNQKCLGKLVGDVKGKTDSLDGLRVILNDLHMNVSQREELTQKFNQLEEELTTFKCLLNPLIEQVTDDNPGGGNQKPVNPVFVAKVDGQINVKPNHRICCKNVWQENNGYDPNIGLFTAPVAGLYYFSISMSTCSDGVFCAAIISNAKPVAVCGSTGKEDEQTGTSVFIRLSVGDRVWVEADKNTHPNGILIGGGFSNFIGCCLK